MGKASLIAALENALALARALPDEGVPVPPVVEPPPTYIPVIGIEEAERYGVKVMAHISGNRYQLREFRHLPPEENRGKHNVYIDVFDKAGQRVPVLIALADHDGRTRSFPLDKRPGEPMGNTPIYPGERLTVWIDGWSDTVHNLHTNHPDELGPNGETWNSYGHHSFYLRFELV